MRTAITTKRFRPLQRVVRVYIMHARVKIYHPSLLSLSSYPVAPVVSFSGRFAPVRRSVQRAYAAGRNGRRRGQVCTLMFARNALLWRSRRNYKTRCRAIIVSATSVQRRNNCDRTWCAQRAQARVKDRPVAATNDYEGTNSSDD